MLRLVQGLRGRYASLPVRRSRQDVLLFARDRSESPRKAIREKVKSPQFLPLLPGQQSAIPRLTCVSPKIANLGREPAVKRCSSLMSNTFDPWVAVLDSGTSIFHGEYNVKGLATQPASQRNR